MQGPLGELCALHRTFVGLMERGERNVSVLNLRQTAQAPRVPLAELFAAQGRSGRRG
jgi:hypothetical protein